MHIRLSACSDWIKSHKAEFAFLVILIATSAFLRLYRIDGYMRFLGDEGRDALVVLHLLRNFDFPFIGPGTSVGNMYMGPLYYYMMTIPMAFTATNPIAAAFMVGCIGVITTVMFYFFAKKIAGPVAGIAASSIYAIGYLPVSMAQSSWNPYPLPFFALLTVWSLYNVITQRRPRWLVVAGVALAFALQMHPLALLLGPLVGFQVIYAGFLFWKSNQMARFFRWFCLAVVAGSLLMSPLLIFDLKHNFMNLNAYKAFLLKRETTVNVNPLNTTNKLWETYNDLYASRLLVYEDQTVGTSVSIVIVCFALIVLALQVKRRTISIGFIITLLWLMSGMIGMTLIKSHVYDHYFGFVTPAIFLLFGLLCAYLWQLHKFCRPVVIILVLGLMLLNLRHNPQYETPHYQLARTQKIASYVLEEANGQPFNFALISAHNYDAAYRFYFEYWNKSPVIINPQDYNATVTDQLYVVCEDDVCQPINNPIYEIAAFGWSKIDSETTVNGVKVFRLVHTTP